MEDNDYILYVGIALGALLASVCAYYLVKKLQKHGDTHKPQVMSKINDFFSTEDSSKPPTNY